MNYLASQFFVLLFLLTIQYFINNNKRIDIFFKFSFNFIILLESITLLLFFEEFNNFFISLLTFICILNDA